MAGSLDPRCEKRIGGANGECSFADGPLADSSVPIPFTMPLADSSLPGTRPLDAPRVEELHYPATDRWLAQRVWIYCPCKPNVGQTPLLVVFDGQTWLRDMRLPDLLDSAISTGLLPPIQVAMVDSRDIETRWAQLGVPAGQAEFVATHLVADLQRKYPISRTPADIVVSGQSLGGIASLRAVALAGGKIGRVIAQSPSLWRFDIAEPLLACQAADTPLPLSGSVSRNGRELIHEEGAHNRTPAIKITQRRSSHLSERVFYDSACAIGVCPS